MANQTPLSGLSDAAGGIILPEAQGALLTNGVLQEAGAFQIAGDARTTTSRREAFAIFNGTPTAEFVGAGGTMPVTGAEVRGGTLNSKKGATRITFTDEMIEDVQNGDINVLVDSGIRNAIADVVDANALGKDSGTNISGAFDSELTSTTQTVELGSGQDALAVAVSAAMGSLEANGYGDFGVVHSSDLARHIRDARVVPGGGTAGTVAGNEGLYQPFSDPLYGLPRAASTNLNTLSESAGSNKVVAVVASRPNLHVRIRHDVLVKPSNEATVGGTSLYQNDLTALRYVTRLGFWVHDLNRSVVAITNAS
jgi:hypothetical protein